MRNTSTKLTVSDYISAIKMRLGVGRFSYKIAPGLYAVGIPTENDLVLVSANYKLTFDTLRKNLKGLNCFILVLDTKGINVWCAASKGTFGTEELIKGIKNNSLNEYINHTKLILPQLGAPGISAHEVKKQSGYDVIYGPIRATDIKEFITQGLKATEEMRRVTFTMWERFVLTPMELIPVLKLSLPVLGTLLALGKKNHIYLLLGSILSGAFFTPLLLPFIKVRAFSLKGWLMGLDTTMALLLLLKRLNKSRRFFTPGNLLLYPALSSFIAMNFTGATTFTSPSGVQKEMKKALPLITASVVFGIVINLFDGGRK